MKLSYSLNLRSLSRSNRFGDAASLYAGISVVLADFILSLSNRFDVAASLYAGMAVARADCERLDLGVRSEFILDAGSKTCLQGNQVTSCPC